MMGRTQDVTVKDETSGDYQQVDNRTTTAKGANTLPLGEYRDTPPALTDGQVTPMQMTEEGVLKVEAGLSEDVIVGLKPRPGRFFIQKLLNGSSSNMNVDGSITPVDFMLVPDTGKKLIIKSLVIVFIDANINFAKFGGITAITNGLEIFAKEGGESERQIDDDIKANKDFYGLSTEVLLESSVKDILKIEIDFAQKMGTQLELIDSRSDYVKMTVNDNLVSIDEMYAIGFGYEVDE